MMDKKRSVSFLILFSFIIVLVLNHIFGYFGHYGYDDMHYAQLANDLLHGKTDFNDHYSYRLPVVLFTALSYKLFAISDFASSLPSLIAAIILITIVFLLLRGESNRTLIAGLSLTTFSNWFIFYSDKLMPDIYVALSVILSLFIVHQYKFRSSKRHIIPYAFLFAFALFFGFTAKETIILIIPLLLYLVIIDIIFKRDIKFWIWSVFFGLLLLFLYFFCIWLITGDYAKRFEAIIQNSYLNHCSYDKQSVTILLKRIVYGFFNLMIYQGIITGYIFIFAFLLQKRAKSLFYIENSFSLFFTSAIILFLSSNFMSVSLTSYVPMCLDPRHYLFLIPVAAIPAAKILSDFIKDKSHGIPIILVMVFVTLLSCFLPGKSLWLLYMPLLILFTLFYFYKNSFKYRIVFVSLFVFVLSLSLFDAITYAQKVSYKKQREIVVDQILNKSEKYYIITDEVQKRLGYYFSRFNNEKSSFVSFDTFDFDTLRDRKKLLLLNTHTMYLSNIEFNDLPYYAKNADSLNTLIYENRALNISIYELNEIPYPAVYDNIILSSFNGFEEFVPHWKQNNNAITDKLFYSGKKSMKADEFPATFSFPLDSLPVDHLDHLIFTCSLFCNFSDKTGSQLVISLENKDGVYIRESIGINKYLKAYSNWWPVKFEYDLNTGKIKASSVLKIYLWNKDKQTGCIDDFDVRIIGN